MQDSQQPLLAPSAGSRKPRLHPSMKQRALVVALILGGAVALALLLPTNKNLPCPFCQVSSVIGWLYFLAWSVSFWPQVIINYKRKSVEGLSFDFTVLNVLGFACYTQFNLSLFASSHVQQEYKARFATTDLPVELNDVVFGLHALVMSSVLAIQCLIYEKHHTQAVSAGTSVSMVGSVATVGVLAGLLAVKGEGSLPYTWLDLCYLCSFIKMAVTLVKYIPQVAMNHSRQSTEGWSIDNVLLDLSGGVLSVAQVLVSCRVLNDWTAVTGNPIKFGLGLVSIGFDIVFMLQHYVWFHPDKAEQKHQLVRWQQQQQMLLHQVLAQQATLLEQQQQILQQQQQQQQQQQEPTEQRPLLGDAQQ